MERRYSVEQYKQMIDDFCDEFPNYRKNLYREEIWSEDIFGMRNELYSFVNDVMCTKKTSLRTVQNQRIILKKFLDWSVKRGYVLHNTLRDNNFTYNDFAERFIPEMEIETFYEDTIEELINGLEFNRELCELIIRAAWEGVPCAKALAEAKYSDILDSQRYSDKLKMVAKAYRRVSVHQRTAFHTLRKPGESEVSEYKNHIIKTGSGAVDELSEEQYVKRTASNINSWMEDNISRTWNGKYRLMYDMIYYSGFIDYVRRICESENKPNEYFVKLFRVGNNERAFKRIGELAENYGLKVVGNEKIRQACYPYIVKSRYFQ